MKTPRLFAAALLALVVALGSSAQAGAQQAPYTAYGIGLQPGQVVVALVGGASCGSSTADAQGNWIISIPQTAPCNPTAGAMITFTLDGKATTAKETWNAGGAPKNIASGTTLVLAADTKPPVITAPADIVVTPAAGATGVAATHAQIAAFLAAATAIDDVDGVVEVTHDAPATFPVGTTKVTFTAKDKAGNVATKTAIVTVAAVKVGTTPGTFASAPADKGISLAAWNGGTVEAAVEAAGPGLASVWVFAGGNAIGYTVGAPAFVNASFLALFPGAEIPAGQILVLVKK
jgi:hypothetical protein